MPGDLPPIPHRLNSDWAWLSQKESQARVAEYGLGTEVSSTFPMSYARLLLPAPCQPITLTSRKASKCLDVFERANATCFSKQDGLFLWRRLRSFLPGYGDHALAHGAIEDL